MQLELSYPAYHPRDTGNSHGKRHLLVSEDYERGRLKRSKGDALCKPASKFWQLDRQREPVKIAPHPETVCSRCRERAERHGLKMPWEPE